MIIINRRQNKENLIDFDAWKFNASKFSNGMYSDTKFHHLYFPAFIGAGNINPTQTILNKNGIY